MGRVRLRDVALQAGITPAAASMALNGRVGVSEETRQAVLRLAREMGYVPHPLARALARGKTGVWGAVLGGSVEVWSRWLEGVLSIAPAMGARIQTYVFPAELKRLEWGRYLAAEGGLDGLLVLDPEGDDAPLRPMVSGPLPVVVSGRRSTWFDSVEIHDRQAVHAALDRLSLDSRRSVALVATKAQIHRDDPRIRAWSEHAQSRAGEAVMAAVGEDTPEAGVRAANELFRRPGPKIGAILAVAGDQTATGILREARLQGLSVPGDLAVAGFGDLPFASWLNPELTTISLPWQEVGEKSCQLLEWRLREQMAPRNHRVLDARLISRRSA